MRVHAHALRPKGDVFIFTAGSLRRTANCADLPCLSSAAVWLQGGEAAEVLQKLLRNVLAAPDEAKYRRLRLSNRRIQQAVVDVSGGVELLQVEKGYCSQGCPCYGSVRASPVHQAGLPWILTTRSKASGREQLLLLVHAADCR